MPFLRNYPFEQCERCATLPAHAKLEALDIERMR
jgi:hypothetical protein